MLTTLSIRDVVLIEHLDLEFDLGLAALTGETGAGKSILLDSLGLTLGARSEASLIRQGADQAKVTALFHLPKGHPAEAVLEEAEITIEDGELSLRRTIGRDGRSRAHVNDQPATVALLRQLAPHLVEVHGQFDTQGLLDPRTHRTVLDAQAGLQRLVATVEEAWRVWREALERRRQAEHRLAEARAEEDYLRHSTDELRSLAPQPGEEAAMAEERKLLQNREKLLAAFTQAQEALEGQDGADKALAAAQKPLFRLGDMAGPRVEALLATLERALAEVADAGAALATLAVDVDADAGALDRIEERLFALRALARKHQVGVDDLAALAEEFEQRLTLLDNAGGGLDALSSEEAAARGTYLASAAELSSKRREAAALLDGQVAAELPPLKLEKARFQTLIEPLSEDQAGPSGMDRVTFTVATNPGAPAGPLNKIASGGELARFMLALKVVLARRMKDQGGTAPSLVFDEVDSGISGAVADAVGERLAHLGADVQVLVVTHSPQVAARAIRQLRVEKGQTELGETRTGVTLLDAIERREEIARMLSGAVVTVEARAAADRLLSGSSSH